MRTHLVLSRETIRQLVTGPITNSAVGCPQTIGCQPTNIPACGTKAACSHNCQTVIAQSCAPCPGPACSTAGGGTNTGGPATECACTVQTL